MTTKTLSQQELVSELLEIVRTHVRMDETFTAQSNLSASGLDSQAMVRVLLAIEEKFGVWIEGEGLTPSHLQNVETLAKHLSVLLESTAQDATAE